MDTVETYFKIGMKYYENGKFQEALDCFTVCMGLEPDNANLFNNRGLAFYMLDQYSNAIQDFDQALILNSTNLRAYFNRGLAKKESGLYQQALEDFNIIKTYDEDFPDVDREIQSVEKMVTGEIISISTLNNLTYDGNNPELALNRGKMLEQNNDFEGAINEYTNAISYQKSFVNAYLGRAKCLAIIEQYDKAIADYETAEKYINDKDVIKANIGNIYATINQLDISLRYLNEAVELNPKNSINYYYRAQTKAKMKKNDSALFDLTKCLELDPVDINAIQQRGIIRANLKDFEGAISDFNIMMRLAPEDGMSYYNRGFTYYQMNEKDKCLLDLKKASSLGVQEADELIKKIF